MRSYLNYIALGTLSLLVTVCISAQAKPSSSNAASDYRVTVSLDNSPTAEVTADLNVVDGRLLMIGGSVDHLPRGWATFIRRIKVTTGDGASLPLEEFSDDKYKAQWRVGNNFNGRAHLSYQVDLSFSQTKWAAGNEQAAFYDGKALFAASRVLFIVSDREAPATVTFNKRAAAKISTPWKKLATKDSFSTTGASLLDNTLVIGEFGGKQMRFGGFEFEIALLGDVKRSGVLISNTLEKFAGMFSRIFAETPPSRYLITLFYADAEDGEAYNQSAAFTTKPPLSDENLIIWGVTLGHELFHFWCGHQIRGANYEESQWFQEGFTEYYSNLAMVREGILPERFFIWKAENILGKYLYFRNAPQFAKISLKDSGQRKTTYRFGVYDGGWAAAFALDITIREKTFGRKSLDDFMRLMYRKYGLTDTPFKYADIVAAAGETVGEDMSDFFKRYVEGVETLPIFALLKKVGYDSAGEDFASELYIYPDKPTALKIQWLKTGFKKKTR